MTIYDRIKKARLSRKMSQEELAKRVGYVGRSAISKVESGERDISQSMLVKYADVLGVSPSYLLYGDDEREKVNIDLTKFSNIFPINKRRIPLLGTIACGTPIFADEDRESYVEIGTDARADFCLKCKGDSMTGARIQDGDIVFIRKQDMVDNGDIAAVIIEDDATLKRVFYYPDEGKLFLQAENSKYPPLVYIGEELNNVRILGKAIAFQSDVS